MQQALAGAELARPYIGIRYEPINRQVQEDENLSIDHGALVSDAQASGQTLPAVIPDGPADKAGVKKGDIITKVGDLVIDSEHPLDLVLASFAPGQTVDLEIHRGGQTLTLTLTLGTRPSDL
jgi:S1-C subfamily serine protease